MISALSVSLGASVFVFMGLWLINVRTKDAGIIDYYWGPGFFVIAIITLVLNGSGTIHEVIFTGAIAFWAIRLATHLIARHNSSTKEDGRYAAMRKDGGPSFWWTSLFKIFLLQAVLLWMVAAPVHVAYGNEFEVGPLFWYGIAIFAVGFVIEWVADWQLASAKQVVPERDQASSLYRGGLWGVSRHPNYAGEMIIWVGIGLASYAMSGSLYAIAGPVLLFALMFGISIPLTEQHMERTRPGDYRAYKDAVPMVFPIRLRPPVGKPTRDSA